MRVCFEKSVYWSLNPIPPSLPPSLTLPSLVCLAIFSAAAASTCGQVNSSLIKGAAPPSFPLGWMLLAIVTLPPSLPPALTFPSRVCFAIFSAAAAST